MPTPITDAYLDEHALPASVQGYYVALPFAVAPNGVAAAGFATRPLHVLKQYATNPRLAVFQ
jgi:hypothetical protein